MPGRMDCASPALVFDLGGVLLDWNPRHLYRTFFDGNEAAMEDFLDEVGFMAWNLELDRGRPFAEGITDLSAQFPHYADLIRSFGPRWQETIAGPIQPVVDLLQPLKDTGRALYALSNWSAETFPQVRGRYDFFDLFEMVLISGEVGVVKPEQAIFRIFLERCERPAQACLFIDDSPANVAAASQMGFAAIHFQSPGQLIADLKDRRILRQS
ncbi:MAG: HAD family phosphatase [Anaerolineales bacterium]|nr:HAD family phosphatase [Anaerolineales bacterium]